MSNTGDANLDKLVNQVVSDSNKLAADANQLASDVATLNSFHLPDIPPPPPPPPPPPTLPSISALTATIDADGHTVHAHCLANSIVRDVTLDEPEGTKLTEAIAVNGNVTFPGIVLGPGVHELSARGHTNLPGVATGDTATDFIHASVTISTPPPPPPPTDGLFGGKKLFMVSVGYVGLSASWALKNAQATKALGGYAMRTDISSIPMADIIVAACREAGVKLYAILGGSVAQLNPQLGIDLLAKYPNDLVCIEMPNEPQTRISAPNYAAMVRACVPPIIGKGVPIAVGALNNSQGGSVTPAARPWNWWDAVCSAYGGPMPGDILSWHWYLSWPGETEQLVAVDAAHGNHRPTLISETGISTYQGTQTYTAQANGLVADINTQLSNVNTVGYGLFQPYDMHAGNGLFADNLGVMGKPAQASVATLAASLRGSGRIL